MLTYRVAMRLVNNPHGPTFDKIQLHDICGYLCGSLYPDSLEYIAHDDTA